MSSKDIMINQQQYYYLVVNFFLNDGKKISCNTLVKNIREEVNKLFYMFSNSLPNNIQIQNIT